VTSLLALIGWGTIYAIKSSVTAQQQPREKADLKTIQGQLTAERDKTKAEIADLKTRWDQLTAEHDRTKVQLAAARNEVVMLRTQLGELQAKASETGSVQSTKKPSVADSGSRAGPAQRYPLPPYLKPFLPILNTAHRVPVSSIFGFYLP